jgi:hypothetical protein
MDTSKQNSSGINFNIYDDSLTVKQGLEKYFKRYNLGNGGYNDKFFKIKIFGSLKLKLPNIQNRIEAVKFHDIHHVLNEYKTGLKGEAEIGAWEIGAGLGKYYSGWLLDLGAVFYGIPLWPKMTFNAFIKGRHSKSLYKDFAYDEKLLNLRVGELRNILGINTNDFRIKVSDFFLFTFLYFGIFTAYALPILAIIFLFIIIL